MKRLQSLIRVYAIPLGLITWAGIVGGVVAVVLLMFLGWLTSVDAGLSLAVLLAVCVLALAYCWYMSASLEDIR